MGVSYGNDFSSVYVLFVYVCGTCVPHGRVSLHSTMCVTDHVGLNGKLFDLLSHLSGPSVVYF